MLEKLQIRDYALIERVTLNFTAGFNILTGETGAGKSILIGALNLILGEKGDVNAIRTGADETVVSAVVSIPEQDTALLGWLAEKGIEPDEGNTLVIRRVVRRNGRGSTYIQSEVVAQKDLQYLSSVLFEIHGQHEHQQILYQQHQRTLLDDFGSLTELVTNYREVHRELSELTDELERAASSERALLRERDMLEYAVEEIRQAGLTADEEDELKTELNVLSNAEQLSENLQTTLQLMKSEYGNGIIQTLKMAEKEIYATAGIDPRLQNAAERLESTRLEIEDIYGDVRRHRETIDFSPERIDEIHTRLQLLQNLKRKYGDTIGAVLEYFDESVAALENMEQSFENREALEHRRKEQELRLKELAAEISRKRRETAGRLSAEVNGHLAQLGMPSAQFVIDVSPGELGDSMLAFSSYGIDRISYEISANSGEPLKPMRDIASGGELSRIMLALKTVLSHRDRVETMIFDEIDSGIGGSVAAAVGRHLAELSRGKQVVCITHLASIAALADTHLLVSKQERAERTITTVGQLDAREREQEIARMLSGDTSVASALQHARDLLRRS